MYPMRVTSHICSWLGDYADKAGMDGYVVGVSGGIDSAVVSALCGRTGLSLTAVSMPILQAPDQKDRAAEHLRWLKKHCRHCTTLTIDLTGAFKSLVKSLPPGTGRHGLAMANTRSRLRMSTLYALANAGGLLVAGTGNKVEDYGVGFFTRWGDGGVDLSPIGSLTKTQVFQLGEFLGVPKSIQEAAPTDGLWADGRTDEDQLGATYAELERAMEICEALNIDSLDRYEEVCRRKLLPAVYSHEVLSIYLKRHIASAFKIALPPVCQLPKGMLL